jgi:acyl-CoA reductase-like NAD-dependent aldehyde dehydrogenase
VYRSQGLFIAGRWRKAADGASMAVVDPATEEESGIGRECGTLGIREFLEAKTVETVI